MTPPFNFCTRTPDARLKAGFCLFRKPERAAEMRFRRGRLALLHASFGGHYLSIPSGRITYFPPLKINCSLRTSY